MEQTIMIMPKAEAESLIKTGGVVKVTKCNIKYLIIKE